MVKINRKMTTLLINAKEPDNAKFILELVKKLGEKGEIITSEKKEDVFLGITMNEEKTGTTVSRDAIFKKLKK